ncbi:MAG: hypothetical protein R2694_08380 [Ilumatobacteraceae bacterium]
MREERERGQWPRRPQRDRHQVSAAVDAEDEGERHELLAPSVGNIADGS